MLWETVSAKTIINRVSNFWSGHKREGKLQILFLNRVRVLGGEPHTHTLFSGSTPGSRNCSFIYLFISFLQGWCGWKGPDFWNQQVHYNMCMPQRPDMI